MTGVQGQLPSCFSLCLGQGPCGPTEGGVPGPFSSTRPGPTTRACHPGCPCSGPALHLPLGLGASSWMEVRWGWTAGGGGAGAAAASSECGSSGSLPFIASQARPPASLRPSCSCRPSSDQLCSAHGLQFPRACRCVSSLSCCGFSRTSVSSSESLVGASRASVPRPPASSAPSHPRPRPVRQPLS